MKQKRDPMIRVLLIIVVLGVIALLLRGCEGGCSLGPVIENTTATTIPAITTSTFSITTTTLEEITCGETLQGICEGSCPDGEVCLPVVQVWGGSVCECIEEVQK